MELGVPKLNSGLCLKTQQAREVVPVWGQSVGIRSVLLCVHMRGLDMEGWPFPTLRAISVKGVLLRPGVLGRYPHQAKAQSIPKPASHGAGGLLPCRMLQKS